MDINRNNYEEYFLLYADNELTDSEKAEVLIFLKQNKDLEEEFRMIHYTICKPDANVELTDKSFLLKGAAGSFINEKNYEEVFVLYHDNELTEIQKKDTEEFLSRHAQLKNDFDLIGLARLTPESAVVFPGKKYLYKKEKTGKVVPVMFWRALVAAVFIGSGLWITQLYVQRGKEGPAIVEKSTPVKPTLPVGGKNALPVEKPVTATVKSSGSNSQHPGTGINEKENLQKSLSQKKNTPIQVLAKTPVKKLNPGPENLNNPSPQKINNDEKINNEVVKEDEKIKEIPIEPIVVNAKIEPSKEIAQNAIQAVAVQPVMPVQNTSYVPDAADNGQNYVFYDITTEEFKKTKVGSFLKKVKRVIERNNPISRLLSGDEKQVVSN